MWMLVFFASALVFLAAIGALFVARIRRRAGWTALASFVVAIVSLVQIGSALDKEAKRAGFADLADQNRAREAGISDAAEWQALRGEIQSARDVEQTASVTPAPIPSEAGECVATLAEFNALRSGMSYTQAVRVLGCPGQEISRVDIPGLPTTVMYSWEGSGMWGANMNATFQADALVQKAQLGLK
jgi:hypothetical protein